MAAVLLCTGALPAFAADDFGMSYAVEAEHKITK